MASSTTGVRPGMQSFIAGFLALLLALSATVAGAQPASANNNPLVISKTATPSPVASGQELTYTIKITNDGGARVSDVVMTDVVNGLTGVDGTNNLVLTSDVGSCSQSGNNVTCDAGTLQGRQVWTVTIRGVVTAANGTTLHNTATVTGTKSAQTFTSSDQVSVQVTSGQPVDDLADLTIGIDVPSATPTSSDFIATLTVANKGRANATDVDVVATLPDTATFVGMVEATSLFTCAHDLPPGEPGGTVSCSGGAVNAGANATIRIGVEAPDQEGALLTFSAAVDPLNTIPESDDLNNSAQATTRVTDSLPDGTLVITKTDNPDPVARYQQLDYTITVTNTHDRRRADHVTVTDGTQGLEAASVQVTADRDDAECTVAAPKVTCELRRLEAGEVLVIHVSGTVIEPPGSNVINTATVNGNIQNTGHTSSATTITTVRPAIDLSVTQHRTFPAPPEPVRAADRFDYQITVGNSGLFNANDVLVRQPLPDGVFFDGFLASQPGTTCAVDAANVLRCTIPQVRGANASGQLQGDTETITLLLIAPHAIGPITSTVTVDPNNAIPEDDETNNTVTTTTDVRTGIDLTVSAVENFDPIARNGTLQYTLTVPNIGTQDTTGVVVRSTLPAGTTFRSAQGTHNLTCSHAAGTVTCVGGIIDGTYSGSLTKPVDAATITIDAFAPDEPGLIHFETRVDPDDTIPEILEDNNIAFVGTAVENGEANGSYKNLSIAAIDVNHDPIATSGTLDYTLTILNTGAADAFNVEVEAKLPAGSRFRSATDLGAAPGQFTCEHTGGVVRCGGGTMTGASGTRQIRIQVFAPAEPGTALLEAMVDPANKIPESDEANNHADKSVVVQSGSPNGVYIDLRVSSITTNHDPVAPDGTLNYLVTIENLGAADAFNVAFRATLPTGARFRSATDQGPSASSFSCTHSSGIVECNGGRVDNGAARVVEIAVFAPSQPGSYRLDVVVDPDNDIPEGDESNNAAEKFTQVQLGGGGGFIDLQVTKAAAPSQPLETEDTFVRPGHEITYTLKVSNAGTDDAFNVKVRDPLPSNVTFVSALGDGNFVCQHSSGVVDCSGGHVKGSGTGGGDRTITIKAKAPLQHDVTITNQAFVDPANEIPESNETNNSAAAEIDVLSQVDLRATNTPGSTTSGQEGDWKFSAILDGQGEAKNVKIVTTLPVGVIPQDVVAPEEGWFCQITENPVNQVTCTTASMSPGEVEFEIRVFVTAQKDKSLTSTTVIDPDDVVVETDPNNNTAQGNATA